MPTKKKLILIGTFLLVLLCVIYTNHFDNGFHFDDSHTIQENVSIRTLKNIPAFFRDPAMFSASPTHRSLRPIVTTSLAIDYWLAGGLNPWMFQLSTFLWHIGLCIMLFFMYRRLLSNSFRNNWVPYLAIFGAAWFGFHTAIAETLNYIISRSDVLSTFFIVASFLTYIAYPQKRKYFLYIIPAAIAAFTKETTFVLIIILFFYILLFEKNLSLFDIFKPPNIKKVVASFLALLPLTIVVGGIQLYTVLSMTQDSKSFGISNPWGYYLLTQTYVWFHYFRSFFLPYDLSADTDLGIITSITDPKIIVGLLFVALLIFAIFKTSKTVPTRPISLGLLWFAASLLPTSLVPFAEVMNDHRMYFAFVGLTLSVVSAIGLLVAKHEAWFEKTNRYKLVISGALLIICINAFGVYKRNQVWDTEETLWKDVTEKSPKNGRGWMNYGLSLMARADYQGAIEAYKKAQITNPFYSYLYINFGIAYGAVQDSADAVSNFTKAIVLAPEDDNSYTYFARYNLQHGNFLEAKNLAEKARALNSHSYMARDIAMGAYQALHMWTELENTANETLALVPNDVKTLEYLRAAKDKNELVISQNTSGQSLPATNALINLSLQQYNKGNYEDCIATCYLVLRADPNNADAYNNICASYNMLKQWDKAKEACTKALQLNPKHPNASANLKWAMDQKISN